MKKKKGNSMKKRVLSFILVLALAVSLTVGLMTPAAAGPTASSFKTKLSEKYLDPDRVYSSDLRWWLSAGLTDESLLESIQDQYDAGFRGAELCMQSDGDASIYGYGGDEWAHKWKLMINKYLDLGMTVSLTSGTNWSTSNVPGLDPDSQQAMHCAAMSATPATVEAGATFSAIVPTPSTRRAKADFIGAYAFKQTANNVADYSSVIDLTSKVTQGADVWTQNITWTAPADGTYRVYGLWSQGTYQASSPAVKTSYCTNYFDTRGVAALREYWEEHYLNEPALNAKILKGDVQLFMDSIEINCSGGITWWSEDMATEFNRRKGYDIRPYLFLMNGYSGASFWSNTYSATPGTYKLAGDNETLREKIIFDYHDVLSTLLRERMLDPLKQWLNSVGIKTRAQISYGKPFEMSEPIMSVDYPETENRVMMNQADYYRTWTGGSKLQNKVLGSETSAQSNNGYRFSRQYHLRDAYGEYAAGIQRMIWHIWSSEYGSGTTTAWPGSVPGMGGVGFYRFSTREPSSRDYDEFNAHLGRIQQLVQTGKARSDIGFISNKWNLYLTDSGEGTTTPATPANINRMNWQLAHQGIFYRSTELQDNGYTYDYFSPKFLDADGVYFNEQTKTIEQAGYKALVLYQNWLDIQGAKKILELAKKGLPIVILGEAASRTPFADGKDTELAGIITQMKALPNVKAVAVANYENYFTATPVGYDDGVYDALQELGVRPYAEFAQPNQQLLTQTRVDEDGNMYLYAYNYCPNTYHKHSHVEGVKTLDHGTNIKTEIKMEGQFVPYAIDAWSGEVTEIANYRYEDGQTIFPIDLDYDNIALFAFEKVGQTKLHVTSTNADSAYADAKGLKVRATKSGTYKTTLSDGEVRQNEVTVPASYDIKNWDVTVQSWTAGATAGNLRREQPQIANPANMVVNSKTSTVKTDINVQLSTLNTWDNIPEVGRNVSGLGHYEATFNWDASKASGAYIDFGDKLEDTMEVWINGKKVGGDVTTNPTKLKRSVGMAIDGVVPTGKNLYTGGINLMKPIVDVSDYLVDGSNRIVIEYSSNLTNVLLSRGTITASAAIYNWFNYVAAYRSYGPKQAVIVPFVDVSVNNTQIGAIPVKSKVLAGENASITLKAIGANNVNTFIIKGTYEGDISGYTLAPGIVSIGTPKIANGAFELAVGSPGVAGALNGDVDLVTLKFAPKTSGQVSATLTDATVAGVGEGDVPFEIDTALNPATGIVKFYASLKDICDISGDGKVSLADLSLAMKYYTFDRYSADWSKAERCDVNGDGIVDMADLIMILANSTP